MKPLATIDPQQRLHHRGQRLPRHYAGVVERTQGLALLRIDTRRLQRRGDVQPGLDLPFETDFQPVNGIARQGGLGRTRFAVRMSRHILEHHKCACRVPPRQLQQLLDSGLLQQ